MNKKIKWLLLVVLLLGVLLLILFYFFPKNKPKTPPIIKENNDNKSIIDKQKDDYDEDYYYEYDEDDISFIYDEELALVGVVKRNEDGKGYIFKSYKVDGLIYGNDEIKYSDFKYINEDYIGGSISYCEEDTNGEEVCDQKYLDILSIKENKLIKRIKKNKNKQYYELRAKENNGFILLVFEGPEAVCQEIYTKDLKLITPCNNDYDSNFYSISDDGNLYITIDGYVKTYNQKGELLKTSKKYNNIVKIIDDYIVLLNSNLTLVTPEGEEIVITNWNKDTMTFHSLISGWQEIDNKEGIYLVVESKNELNNESTTYEYYYIPTTKEVGKIETTIDDYTKPELYLHQ